MKRTLLAALAAVTLGAGLLAPLATPATAAEFDAATVSNVQITVNPGLATDSRDQKVEATGAVTSPTHGAGTVTVSSPRSGVYSCTTGTSNVGTFRVAYADGYAVSGNVERLLLQVGGSFEVDGTVTSDADGTPFVLRAAPVVEDGNPGSGTTQTCLDAGNNGRSKTFSAAAGTATTGTPPPPAAGPIACEFVSGSRSSGSVNVTEFLSFSCEGDIDRDGAAGGPTSTLTISASGPITNTTPCMTTDERYTQQTNAPSTDANGTTTYTAVGGAGAYTGNGPGGPASVTGELLLSDRPGGLPVYSAAFTASGTCNANGLGSRGVYTEGSLTLTPVSPKTE